MTQRIYPRPRPILHLLWPAALGAAASLLTPQLPSELRLLTGWLTFSALYLLSTWRMLLSTQSQRIRELADLEDNGRRLSHLLVSAASLVSLGGVVMALHKASDLSKSGQHHLEAWLTGSAVLSVALSWLLIQTVYTLRYAHLYYEKPEGSVDFIQTPEPDYLDFAYLAFTIGMTYQVSDTNISQRPMRRLLLSHALLSYLYGVVIIALAINVVSGLLS